MEEPQMRALIGDLLLYGMDTAAEEGIDQFPARVEGLRTFEEAGLLTSNEGLVARLSDGSEIQITIVKSR